MSDYPAQSGADLYDIVRQALPHGGFDLAAVMRGQGVREANPATYNSRDALVILCRCGRRLEWPAGETLRMDILIYWLADHDDEMFLAPDEIEFRHSATLTQTAVKTYDMVLPPGLADPPPLPRLMRPENGTS